MKNLLIITLLFVSISIKAQEKQLTDEEKIYGLSLIWQEMNYNFVYMPDSVNWDSVYLANIPKVVAAKSLTEYYDILSGIINSFHERHTQMILPEEVINNYGFVPIKMAYIDGKYYVIAYAAKYKGRLSIGSILTSVNSYDVDTYYDKFVFPNYNTAADCSKRLLSKGRFFAGHLDEQLSATFLDSTGKSISLKLKRIPYTEDLDVIKPPRMYEFTDFSYKNYDSIAYVRIGSFQNTTARDSFINIVDKLKNSKAIIFDVRDNTGGNSQFATDIISYFTDKNPISLWWGEAKVNNSFARANGIRAYLHGDSLEKSNNYYADYVTLSHFEGGNYQYKYPNKTKGELKDIPIVLLCNSNTVSSGESFIVQLKQVAKVTVIGERSAGSMTFGLEIPLTGGGGVKIASIKSFDENGKPYTFTQPDIVHIPSLEDEKTGTDSVLKIAIDFINNGD